MIVSAGWFGSDPAPSARPHPRRSRTPKKQQTDHRCRFFDRQRIAAGSSRSRARTTVRARLRSRSVEVSVWTFQQQRPRRLRSASMGDGLGLCRLPTGSRLARLAPARTSVPNLRPSDGDWLSRRFHSSRQLSLDAAEWDAQGHQQQQSRLIVSLCAVVGVSGRCGMLGWSGRLAPMCKPVGTPRGTGSCTRRRREGISLRGHRTLRSGAHWRRACLGGAVAAVGHCGGCRGTHSERAHQQRGPGAAVVQQ